MSFAFIRRFPWSLVVAALLCFVVLAIKISLENQIGNLTPFLLFFGAIMLATWNGGAGAGGFATALSVTLVAFFFLPPHNSLRLTSAGLVQCGVYVLECTFTSLLTALARSAQDKFRGQIERQSALAELSQLALTAETDLEPLFERAVVLSAQTLDAPRAALLQLERFDDVSRDCFLVRAAQGLGLQSGQKAPADPDAPAARAIKQGFPNGDVIGNLHLPVGAIERAWGVLEISDNTQNSARVWTSEQLDWARAVANILGVALAAQSARQRAAQGETRYRTFVSQSSEAIWRFEMDEPFDVSLGRAAFLEAAWDQGFLAECNDTYAQMYGFESAREMIGMRLWQVLPREDAASTTFLNQIFDADFRLSDAESVEIDRNGQSHIFLNNLIGIVENNRLLRVWGTQRDVTRERAAARELSASEKRFRSLFDAAPVPISIGRANEILYANQQFARLIGYQSVEEVIGLSSLDFVAPAARKLLAERARNRARGNAEPSEYETVGQRRDGSQFLVRVEITQIVLPEGEATLIFLFDLTQQKRADAAIAGLLDDARGATARAQNLQQISFDLLTARAFGEVAQLAIERITDAVGARGGVLMAPDDPDSPTRLEAITAQGYPAGALERYFSIPVESAHPMTHVFLTRESLWMSEAEDWVERFPSLGDTLPRTGTRAIAILPLEVEGRVASVMALSYAEPRAFDAAERLFLLTLANSCAQALERARLDAQSHELERQQRESLALLNTLLKSAPVGFALFDRDERYVLLNEALAEMNGAPVSQHLGKTMDDIAPAPEPRFNEALRAVWQSGEPSGEFILSDDSGPDKRFCLVSLYPVRMGEAGDLNLGGLPNGSRDAIAQAGDVVTQSGEAVSPLGARGELLGVGAVVIEISERVRAEEEKTRLVAELEVERARFEAILQQMPSAVIIAEAPSGRMILSNPQVERVMGVMSVPVALNSLDDYVGYWPDGRLVESHEWALARAVAHGEVIKDEEVTVPHTDAGGGVDNRVVRITAAPIRDRDGQITAGIAIFDDVTDRARSEATQRFLADAGSALIATLDSASANDRLARLCVPDVADWCIIAVPDEDGLLRHASLSHVAGANPDAARRFEERLNVDPDLPWDIERALSSGRAQLYVAHDLEHLRRVSASPEYAQLIQEIGARSAIVAPLAARGRTLGLMIWITAESQRSYDARDLELAEELARRAALTIDNARLLGDAQTARDQAQEANRAKDEFLAVVSHELRTPLTPILGWLDLLRSPGIDDAMRAQAFDVIERNARAQAQLVNDILDVSRITSGKLRLELKPLDLTALVRGAVQSLSVIANEKGVELQLELEEVGQANADASRFQQVVWNLLSNAIKFTPRAGVVTVSLRSAEQTAILQIADSGVGIGAEFLPSVFDAFRQADSSSTRKAGGLGLGLAIVRHIVEEHGGAVSAQSAGEGLGATFRVELPLLAAAQTEIAGTQAGTQTLVSAPQLASARLGAPLKGARVLLVDDEADTRETLARLLERQGARVRVAASALAALQTLDVFEPQLLISDIGMPGTDGYSLLGQIRARCPDLPAIALTAYTAPTDIERARAAGFERHLAKPVEPRELFAAAGDLLGAP